MNGPNIILRQIIQMRRSADSAAELSLFGEHRFRDDHRSDDWTLTSARVFDTSAHCSGNLVGAAAFVDQ